MASTNLPHSKLELVELVDTWPYYFKDVGKYNAHMYEYYFFMIEGYGRQFGYIHNSFVHKMLWPIFWELDHVKRTVTLITATDFGCRTRFMEATLRRNIGARHIGVLSQLKNKLVPISAASGEHVLDIDGIGVDVFGIIKYSVQLLGWVNSKDGREYWVPQRFKDIESYPGKLENTVGGDLLSGEKAIDCIVRECKEKISLDPLYTRANIKACGTVSFHMAKTELGFPGCQPHVQYLYELEFAEDFIPIVPAGEVDGILSISLEEVQSALANGEFKLNCVMTWLVFLIRHGHLDAENEPNLVEICSRLNRRIQL